MNSKALLVLLVSIAYWFGAHWFYSSNHESECCPKEAASTIIEKERGPLMFKWSDPTTLISEKSFPGFKANHLAGMNAEGNIFEITGKYFEGETAPEGYADMGIARAEAIYNERFKADIPATRVRFKSEKLRNVIEGARTEEFDAAAFNWLDAPKEAPKVIETANSALIYFDFNATKKKVNPTVDDYLKRVSERLQANPTERITITGHTDDKGDNESNMKLGDRRAKMVRDILISYGVDIKRISTASKGESEPVQSNDTDKGRAANRRAEVRIVK